MDDLVIRLLGGVRAVRGGHPVPVGGRRVRALLAVLSVSAGRTLPADLLAERIWDAAELPARPRAGVQTLVSRLRAALGSGVVVTGEAGYRLDLPRERVDVLAFTDALARAAGATSPDEERHLLLAALDRWEGPLFGEELSTWLGRYEVPRLTAVHLRAVERRVDLDLEAGDTTGCAEELRVLIAEHPLRETLWVRLLRVLRAEGHVAEALGAYEQIRTRLAEELGTDPAPGLQDEHQRLLHDGAPPSAPSRPVPRQLPADVAWFTGRSAELGQLDAILGDPDTRLAVVHGPGGSGKTSLAVHWAHRAAHQFPDGQLYLDLRGFGRGPAMTPRLALDLLLRAAGVPGDQIPESLEARAPLLRSALADRRVLVVLDNASDPEQVRPLVSGGRSAVLVTSRRQLRGLTAIDGAVPLPLGPMEPAEAVDLVRRRLRGTEAPDAQLEELVLACGHLPIALVVAAERAGRQGRGSIGDLIERLRDERSRLGELSAGGDPLTDVRGVFATTVESLDPVAARTFRLLALHPGGPFSTGSAAAITGLASGPAERALDDLVDRHLLQQLRPGWFDLHDLARDYATELLREADDADQESAALSRLHSWLIHSAEAACMALGRYPPLIETGPLTPHTTPEPFPGPRHALAWFVGHRRALSESISRAVQDADHQVVCRMAPRLLHYLVLLSAGAEQLALARTALASAQALGNDEAICGAANNLGIVHGRARRTDEAMHYFELSVRHAEAAGHRLAAERARSNIALLHDITGQHDLAVEEITRQLADLSQRGEDPRELPMLLNNLANAHLHAGRPEEALRRARECHDLSRRVGATDMEATALSSIGSAQLALGDAEAACTAFGLAVEVDQAIGNAGFEARDLRELAEAELRAGRPAAARHTVTRCLRLIDEIESSGGASTERAAAEQLLASLPGTVGERGQDTRER
nr:BTAD domain-containing putative transcriptional regulator [Ornithinimicrobium sp. F0845]